MFFSLSALALLVWIRMLLLRSFPSLLVKS